MASASWVSRIRQAPSGAAADDEAAFVLLHATAEGDGVSSPDLRLVATEGTSPFVGLGETRSALDLIACGADEPK